MLWANEKLPAFERDVPMALLSPEEVALATRLLSAHPKLSGTFGSPHSGDTAKKKNRCGSVAVFRPLFLRRGHTVHVTRMTRFSVRPRNLIKWNDHPHGYCITEETGFP